MSKEGILRRGKKNYNAGKFLDNSETMAYIETLKEVKEEPKKKEKKKNGR